MRADNRLDAQASATCFLRESLFVARSSIRGFVLRPRSRRLKNAGQSDNSSRLARSGAPDEDPIASGDRTVMPSDEPVEFRTTQARPYVRKVCVDVPRKRLSLKEPCARSCRAMTGDVPQRTGVLGKLEVRDQRRRASGSGPDLTMARTVVTTRRPLLCAKSSGGRTHIA